MHIFFDVDRCQKVSNLLYTAKEKCESERERKHSGSREWKIKLKSIPIAKLSRQSHNKEILSLVHFGDQAFS